MGAFGQAGHRIIFIHQREVMEFILLLNQHSLHAIFKNDSHLARVGRIPGPAIRDRAGDHQTRAILML